QVQAHQEGDTEGDGQGAAHYERRLTEHRSIAGRWDGSRPGASLERPYNGLAEELPRHPDVEKPRVRESRGLRPERAGVVELLVVVPHGLGAPPGSLVAPRNRLPVGDPGVLEIEHRVLGRVFVAVAKVPAWAQRAMDATEEFPLLRVREVVDRERGDDHVELAFPRVLEAARVKLGPPTVLPQSTPGLGDHARGQVEAGQAGVRELGEKERRQRPRSYAQLEHAEGSGRHERDPTDERPMQFRVPGHRGEGRAVVPRRLAVELAAGR